MLMPCALRVAILLPKSAPRATVILSGRGGVLLAPLERDRNQA